ncbi:MAG TPA: hypothetical protein VJK06_05090, partial [Methyloceanibacter sp.]|nr:hypothetical protein [Methyloceanibacter sp.]
KMVHAALLLLMLEAANCGPRFTHQPEAQNPKSSAIHKSAGRLPHLWVISRHSCHVPGTAAYPPEADISTPEADALLTANG